MKKKGFLVVALLASLFVCGCITKTDDTGQTTYSVDPNAITAVEKGGDATVGILNILGVFWPVLLTVAGAAGGVLGTLKKVKPQLTEAQTEANLYHVTTASIVQALEDFKFVHPDEWKKLERQYFTDAIGLNAENVIRALRGLPPKE